MMSLLFWKGKCVKMTNKKETGKGIEGLLSEELIEKVKKAKKKRQREEKESKQKKKYLDNKRKNLTDFLHNVYGDEIVQEFLKDRFEEDKYYRLPVYRFGLATMVFEKRGIYLSHGWVHHDEFGKGYLEVKDAVSGPGLAWSGVERISIIDLAEKVRDTEKFKQTVLRNVKKQREKYYR